ncbi:hypothetical protein CSUI_001645 [Cystoisospora suis]|uniref:Uncharacterized protein n=1 Tax=Cystoisospora suis TaxID=483139 RepID=A0A2C6LBQ3_9APIC|nr:hypothetical protein CSUI_001645 [Cystoisospora suis]
MAEVAWQQQRQMPVHPSRASSAALSSFPSASHSTVMDLNVPPPNPPVLSGPSQTRLSLAPPTAGQDPMSAATVGLQSGLSAVSVSPGLVDQGSVLEGSVGDAALRATPRVSRGVTVERPIVVRPANGTTGGVCCGPSRSSSPAPLVDVNPMIPSKFKYSFPQHMIPKHKSYEVLAIEETAPGSFFPPKSSSSMRMATTKRKPYVKKTIFGIPKREHSDLRLANPAVSGRQARETEDVPLSSTFQPLPLLSRTSVPRSRFLRSSLLTAQAEKEEAGTGGEEKPREGDSAGRGTKQGKGWMKNFQCFMCTSADYVSTEQAALEEENGNLDEALVEFQEANRIQAIKLLEAEKQIDEGQEIVEQLQLQLEYETAQLKEKNEKLEKETQIAEKSLNELREKVVETIEKVYTIRDNADSSELEAVLRGFCSEVADVLNQTKVASSTTIVIPQPPPLPRMPSIHVRPVYPVPVESSTPELPPPESPKEPPPPPPPPVEEPRLEEPPVKEKVSKKKKVVKKKKGLKKKGKKAGTKGKKTAKKGTKGKKGAKTKGGGKKASAKGGKKKGVKKAKSSTPKMKPMKSLSRRAMSLKKRNSSMSVQGATALPKAVAEGPTDAASQRTLLRTASQIFSRQRQLLEEQIQQQLGHLQSGGPATSDGALPAGGTSVRPATPAAFGVPTQYHPGVVAPGGLQFLLYPGMLEQAFLRRRGSASGKETEMNGDSRGGEDPGLKQLPSDANILTQMILQKELGPPVEGPGVPGGFGSQVGEQQPPVQHPCSMPVPSSVAEGVSAPEESASPN